MRSEAENNEYTCPMHPEVRQNGPGSCPKCGMALEPLVINLPSTKTEYTCPMHPEIVRDGPGLCPICGMALEPRTVTGGEESVIATFFPGSRLGGLLGVADPIKESTAEANPNAARGWDPHRDGHRR